MGKSKRVTFNYILIGKWVVGTILAWNEGSVDWDLFPSMAPCIPYNVITHLHNHVWSLIYICSKLKQTT